MKKKRVFAWVAISLALCLISMIGVSVIQSKEGSVVLKEMNWESPSGHQLNGMLYIPANATKDHKAPAIITVEGWYNNKEMQDLYTVEFARRGYVVLALDMASHGNSESLTHDQLYDGAVGVDGATQLVASLPYVDTTKIGITGHSSGATASNMAIAIDNKRTTHLIKATFLQAGDWQDDLGNDHSDDYGNRSVGIIASKHDDFYFGTYDKDGNMLTPPIQFMQTEGAKKFLNFNQDPSTFQGTPEAGKYYEKTIGGETAYRVIYRPNMVHPAVTFSSACVSYALDYFQKTLGEPTPIPASNQVWQWKTVFNVIGLIGFFLFMVSFTLAMMETEYFRSLKADKEAEPATAPKGSNLVWFWGGLIACAIVSALSYLWTMKNIYSITTPFFTQTGPLSIGVWSVISGLFCLLVLVLYYFFYAKKNGFSLKKSGVLPGWRTFGKTALLSVIVVTVCFSIVFFANYFFKADFRLWVFGIKAFQSDKVLIALRYLPFFLIFYVINSISINCFNYNAIGKKKWVNITLLALFNSLGGIVLLAMQYITFYATGYQLWHMTEGDRIGPIWLYSVIFILFGAAIVSRILYKKTKNPYLAAFITAMIITMISCSNTTTILGGAQMIATAF